MFFIRFFLHYVYKNSHLIVSCIIKKENFTPKIHQIHPKFTFLTPKVHQILKILHPKITKIHP